MIDVLPRFDWNADMIALLCDRLVPQMCSPIKSSLSVLMTIQWQVILTT